MQDCISATSLQRSQLDPVDNQRRYIPQHQHRPTLGQAKSLRTIRTTLAPRHSEGSVALSWLIHSSGPSSSLQKHSHKLLQSLTKSKAIDSSACAVLLARKAIRTASLVDDLVRSSSSGVSPSIRHISSMSAMYVGEDPPGHETHGTDAAQGPEVRGAEEGHHASLLMEALTRAGARRSSTADSACRGSRLLYSRASSNSGNFKPSKRHHTEGSICGDAAMSNSASEAQSLGVASDKGKICTVLFTHV